MYLYISTRMLYVIDSEGADRSISSKKSRTCFSRYQLQQLEMRYRVQRYLPTTDRRQLARELSMSDQQVKTWYQNRRMKEKRHVQELNEICGVDKNLASGRPLFTASSLSSRPLTALLMTSHMRGLSQMNPLTVMIPPQTHYQINDHDVKREGLLMIGNPA